MKLSCSQMDVLISFYIEEELSSSLKKQVEEHLRNCSICRAKFDIIKNMIDDLKNCFEEDSSKDEYHTKVTTSQQYRAFQNNLSAYLDNELDNNENLKLKKFTINNKTARKELQANYNLRKLMNNSFQKTKLSNKQDYSKSILRKLEIEDETSFNLHPLVKSLIGFLFLITILTVIAFFMIG